VLPTQTCLQLLSNPPTPTQPTLAPREFLTLSGRWVSSRPSVSNGFRACLRGRGKIPDFTLYRQRYCFAHKNKCAHKNISLGQGQRKRQDSSKPPRIRYRRVKCFDDARRPRQFSPRRPSLEPVPRSSRRVVLCGYLILSVRARIDIARSVVVQREVLKS